MTDRALRPLSGQPRTEVAEFLDQLKTKTPTTVGGRGRLIVALDATASREPTWDVAAHLTNEMFTATVGYGGLATKLMFYRGIDKPKNSRWLYSAAELRRVMSSVRCEAGKTQIEPVLRATINETQRAKVSALVFVGDAMEENLDSLAPLASELGTLSTPAFMLQEGAIPQVAAAFKLIAARSGGAYLAFDLAGIDRLKELFGGIAVFASGGYQALENYSAKKGGEVLQLTAQLRRPGG